jgi:predicted nuclease with RNAse H fold
MNYVGFGEKMRIIGINISATEGHISGVAQLDEGKIRTYSVYKDKDIIELINSFKPNIVVFDVPLHLSNESYRNAEKEMVAMGFDPEPQNMGDNKLKIKRAINLKAEAADPINFLETHLASVKKVLNINDTKQLQNVRVMNVMKNDVEKNAVFVAVVGLFYSENLYQEFGDEESGIVVLPKL